MLERWAIYKTNYLTMRFHFVLFSLLFLACSCSQTKEKQITQSQKRIFAVCDSVVMMFQNKKVIDACNLLREHSALIDDASMDTLQKQMIDQVNTGMLSNYGNPKSFEVIAEQKFGDAALKRYYAMKFDHFFYVVQFALYNTGEKWEITGFRYSEGFKDLY